MFDLIVAYVSKTLPLTNCFLFWVNVYMREWINIFNLASRSIVPCFWAAPSCPVFMYANCCIGFGCVAFCVCKRLTCLCVDTLGGGLPRRCRQAPNGCRAEKGDDGHLAQLVAEDAGLAGHAAQG